METPSAPNPPSPPAQPESEKRKRQPRNSACQACASLKMKCVPSSSPTGRCDRCQRMDRDCLPSIPKPRKRRTVGDGDAVSPPFRPYVNTLESNVTPGAALRNDGEQEVLRRALLSRSDLSHQGSESFTNLFAQGLGIEASAGNLLGGIDYSYVQTCFTVFRQLIGGFPFVSMRPDIDAVSMTADRPMTTLAICAVASSAKPHRQARLAQAFRLALAAKVIVKGERGLDHMVGLLIFLAWHHNYMAKQQMTQMVYMLAGMAADLGLYRQPYTNSALDSATAVERDRSFLLCYYMCSGMSAMGFDSVPPLRWTNNLRKCADNVERFGTQAGDRFVPGITEMAKIIEDLEESLRSEGETKRTTQAAYVDIHCKSALNRVKALKREHPGLGETLGCEAAIVHIYHRLLRADETPDASTLIQAACAIKEYVDDILARSPITLHRLPIIDWVHLLEVLLLMSRISRSPSSNMGWEAGALSSMLQPDTVLDAISAHMASAPKDDPLAPRHETQLTWFQGLCDNIKRQILSEKGNIPGNLRNGNSHFDLVHSLGSSKQVLTPGSSFKPVNEPYASELPTPGSTALPDMGFGDSFDLLDHGLLDDNFWDNFLHS